MSTKKPTQHIFTTIVKDQRGSLHQHEIDEIIDLFTIKNILKDKSCLIVKELRNKYQQDYIHLHIYQNLHAPRTPESVRRTLLPSGESNRHISFYETAKDVDVKCATDVDTLIGGYFLKTNDYEILHNTLPSDQINKSINNTKERNTKFLKNLIGHQRQTTINELPFLMRQYATENNFNYTTSIQSFKDLYYLMYSSEKYALTIHFKSIKTIKIHLDILYGNRTALDNYIDETLINELVDKF